MGRTGSGCQGSDFRGGHAGQWLTRMVAGCRTAKLVQGAGLRARAELVCERASRAAAQDEGNEGWYLFDKGKGNLILYSLGASASACDATPADALGRHTRSQACHHGRCCCHCQPHTLRVFSHPSMHTLCHAGCLAGAAAAAMPNAMHPPCTPTCATIWLSSAEPTSPGPMIPTATFCMVGMRGGMQMLSRRCGLRSGVAEV